MNEITRRAGEGSVAPPSFEQFESMMVALQEAREANAIAYTPSQELLAQLDAAIAVVERRGAELRAAAAPASSIEAGMYLGLLMKGFSNSGLQDARIYGRLLLEDVLSAKPSVAAVDIACRHWRRRQKFLPAISEMLTEIAAVQQQIDGVVDFAARLPALRDKCAAALSSP